MKLLFFLFLIGLAGFGITAKDRDVTGGTKGQPSSPGALKAANQAPRPSDTPSKTLS